LSRGGLSAHPSVHVRSGMSASLVLTVYYTVVNVRKSGFSIIFHPSGVLIGPGGISRACHPAQSGCAGGPRGSRPVMFRQRRYGIMNGMSDSNGADQQAVKYKTGSNQYAKRRAELANLPPPPMARPLVAQAERAISPPVRDAKPQGPPTDQTRALGVALQADVPVMLWGLPGIGKTAVIEAWAEAAGAHCEVIIGSQYEPADIAGQPWVVDGELRRLPPEYAARINALPPGRDSVLFLDELDKAPPAVSAAMLRLVRERKVGDITLPARCRVIAAANPPELGGWDLSSPMANRFVHLNWKPSDASIIQGLGTGMWPGVKYEEVDSEQLTECTNRWHGLIAAFLETKPNLIHSFPKDESKQGLAWPSPRTWENVIKLGATCEATGQSPVVLAQLVNGSVGDGPGVEFTTFIRNMDLPFPEAILKDPDKSPIPDRGDKVAAVCHSLASAISGNTTQARLDAGIKYLERVSQQRHADAVLPAMRVILSIVFGGGKYKIPQEDQAQRFVKSLYDCGLGDRTR